MLNFTVNSGRCIRCSKCVQDCPMRIIERERDAVPFIRPDKETLCIQCQHCLAVCPAAAISILGRNPDDSLPLSADSFPRLEQMNLFIRGRRSIRQYKDTNVDPALIRQLMATLANVPTGVNRRALTFTLIGDKAVMDRLRARVYGALAGAFAAHRLPERYTGLQQAITDYNEKKNDMLFRGAPHALIVSAPPDAPCPQQDVALALAYFELLAQSAGLGTVWWGMLRMVGEGLPELKELLGLPADHAYYAMLFGVPAIRYARTVQRDDAARVKTVAL